MAPKKNPKKPPPKKPVNWWTVAIATIGGAATGAIEGAKNPIGVSGDSQIDIWITIGIGGLAGACAAYANERRK